MKILFCKSIAFEHMNVDSLVMAAIENSQAARVYEQVGFRPVERQVGVLRYIK